MVVAVGNQQSQVQQDSGFGLLRRQSLYAVTPLPGVLFVRHPVGATLLFVRQQA